MMTEKASPFPFVRWFVGLGVSAVFVGWLYGVIMVGVPLQDATPEQARREAVHLAISEWAATLGVLLLLLALGLTLKRRLLFSGNAGQ